MNTITRIDYAATRERLARASCVGSVAMQAVRPICVELHHFGRDRQRSSYVAFWHKADARLAAPWTAPHRVDSWAMVYWTVCRANSSSKLLGLR